MMDGALLAIVESFLAGGATSIKIEKVVVGSRFGNQTIEIHYLQLNRRLIKIYDSLEDGFSIFLSDQDAELSESTVWHSHSASVPKLASRTAEKKRQWASSVVNNLVKLIKA